MARLQLTRPHVDTLQRYAESEAFRVSRMLDELSRVRPWTSVEERGKQLLTDRLDQARAVLRLLEAKPATFFLITEG